MKKLLLIATLLMFPCGLIQASTMSDLQKTAPETAEPVSPTLHEDANHPCGPAQEITENLVKKGWKIIWGGDIDSGKLMLMENDKKDWMLSILANGASDKDPTTPVTVLCLLNGGENSTHQ